jgi:glycosyltransferase involved in cell wall biosynthesis
MNLLIISYWGIQEGLTHSTVIPHIKILSQYDNIDRIILVTIERASMSQLRNISSKSEHIPIRSSACLVPVIGKIWDFIIIPKVLKQYCIDFHIDKIIARGVIAGALAYKTSKKTRLPFFVESFEPHADYMKETGVWRKWGIKYFIQKRWEVKQCLSASGIMTVTKGYTDYLKTKYTSNRRILTVPCAVDLNMFKYNPAERIRIRMNLGFGETQTIGVYAGKFGGLYINISDLKILKILFQYFPDLGLIFLTSIPEQVVYKELRSSMNLKSKIIIRNVHHKAVPQYLSAADFALSLNKTFHSGRFLSPVKIAEYWANGLPVLMTAGIGDESKFIEKEKGGVLFNTINLTLSLGKLKNLINDPEHRTKIPNLARKYRSFNTVKAAYEKLIVYEE